MEIKFTEDEALDIFHTALCNAVGTNYINSYGIELTYSGDDYKEAKKSLHLKNINATLCYEDILIEMLRIGKTLIMIDYENDDEKKEITIHDVINRIGKVPFRNLSNILQETDDVYDADAVIQTIFYEEIIFG
jgi:hypothetical protein